MMYRLLPFWLSALSAMAGATPVELGAVRWLGDLDQGLGQSQATGRPVLILFQEVPGCSTCRSYGEEILSHPLIVEAVEDLFVPVVVFNNRGGRDQAALERFREPSWNNPVVRIVDGNGRALAERVSGDYSRLGLVNAMTHALRKSHTEIPTYLRLLQAEFTAESRATDRAVFARSEEQQRVAEPLLGRRARPATDAVRPDPAPKYYLAQTRYRHVPMTPRQAARVNGAIGARTDPGAFLSPRQRALLQTVQRHPNGGWPDAIGAPDLAAAWSRAQRLAADPRLPASGTLDLRSAGAPIGDGLPPASESGASD